MNFFEEKDRAKSRTSWLVAIFIVGVVLLILLLNAFSFFILQLSNPRFNPFEHLELFAGISTCIIATIATGAIFKAISLRRDGGISLALSLNAKLIDVESRDEDERRLLNIVEEMAVASGIPVPSVFLLDRENCINAFVAGNSIHDTVVVVTNGALKILARDELQAVIAHEFSHIFHGDTRLNMKLHSLLFGIFIISQIGSLIIRGNGRRTSRKGGGQILLIGIGLFIIGWVGVFVGRLIQAAVSRQRECLADASSVQYTRNPEALASALKKIGGLASASFIAETEVENIAHFFFASVKPLSFSHWFSTHPPLKDRILELDPSFRGRFESIPPLPANTKNIVLTDYDRKVQKKGRFVAFPNQSTPIDTGFIGGQNGGEKQGPSPVERSATILNSIPGWIRAICHDSYSCRAIFFALIFQEKGSEDNRQLETIKEKSIRDLTQKIYAGISSFDASVRLALFEICLSTLRQYSSGQLAQLKEDLRKFIEADGQFSRFEYFLIKTVTKSCDSLTPNKKRPPHLQSLSPLREELRFVLSFFSHLGGHDVEASFRAFQSGALSLRIDLGGILPENECRLRTLDETLDVLSNLTPILKKRVLYACARIALNDERLVAKEIEFMKLFALCMECPLPFLIQDNAILASHDSLSSADQKSSQA